MIPTRSVLASLHLEPGGVIAWLLVGVIAGWLAGLLTRSKGFGCFGNVVIGLLGAGVGVLVFSIFDVQGVTGFWGSVVVATVGALIVLVLARLAGRRGR